MNKKVELRWKLRFENYEKAFKTLEESINAYKKDCNNRFIQDSIIQRYEYTIELIWKTLKDYLTEQGFFDINSPKNVIRKAFEIGLIKNGDKWMKAIDDRNKTSHTYDEEIADEITKDIIENHFELFQDIYFTLKKEI